MIRWAITAAVLLALIATPKAPKATKTKRTRGVDVDLDTRTC